MDIYLIWWDVNSKLVWLLSKNLLKLLSFPVINSRSYMLKPAVWATMKPNSTNIIDMMAVYSFIIGLKRYLSVDSIISPLLCPVRTPNLAAVDDLHVGSFRLIYNAHRQFMVGGCSSAFHTSWLILSAVSIMNMLEVLQPTRILLSCCYCAADH